MLTDHCKVGLDLPHPLCHKLKIADMGIVDIHLLVGKLNGLPLALAQAGSFIGMTNCDVQKYIYHFGRTWSDLMQKQDQFSLQEYGERSMLTTWKLSYDQVLRQSETAAWLLRLWAFFYHDDLWYGLLAKSGIAPNAEEFEEFEHPECALDGKVHVDRHTAVQGCRLERWRDASLAGDNGMCMQFSCPG